MVWICILFESLEFLRTRKNFRVGDWKSKSENSWEFLIKSVQVIG